MTGRGRDVLFGREAIELRADALAPKGGARAPRKARRGEPVAGVAGMDMGLLGRLKAVRAALAREGNVPAYVVFPDRTLIEMAASRPASLAALARVHGVGAASARWNLAESETMAAQRTVMWVNEEGRATEPSVASMFTITCILISLVRYCNDVFRLPNFTKYICKYNLFSYRVKLIVSPDR